MADYVELSSDDEEVAFVPNNECKLRFVSLPSRISCLDQSI